MFYKYLVIVVIKKMNLNVDKRNLLEIFLYVVLIIWRKVSCNFLVFLSLVEKKKICKYF